MKCKVTREEQESARSRDTWDLGASWEQACRMGCQGDTAGVGRGVAGSCNYKPGCKDNPAAGCSSGYSSLAVDLWSPVLEPANLS